MIGPGLKQKVGCWLHERWRAEWVLHFPQLARFAGTEWMDLCNRNETVVRKEHRIGRQCQWKDSSLLTVCRMFPAVGARLLRHVWSVPGARMRQNVSIIVPVRGVDRLDTVAYVIKALHELIGPDSEILICEHDTTPRFQREWPVGVRHLFIPAKEGESFNKSRAMNAGAKEAVCPILVFHDGDVIPSPDYFCQILPRLSEGWEAVRPIRLLFLLEEADSRRFMKGCGPEKIHRISEVQQNNPGVSTVVRRDTYLIIGGHDERFEGWGGEDQEFLDRLETRRIYPGSFLPAIHLWHPPAEQKQSGFRNAVMLEAVLNEPRAIRIETLRNRLINSTS